MKLQCRQVTIDCDKPLIMGVINYSPNSFHAPVADLASGLEQAERMIAEGADILDIGGEATNPFITLDDKAPETSEEINRVVPLIREIKARYPKQLLSVDTSKAEVMQAAIEAGVDIVNDQRALRMPGALDVVANSDVAVCLMHMFLPSREHDSCSPEQLLQRIITDLKQWAQRCIDAGIEKSCIMLDPGFGGGRIFSKSTAENCYLMKHIDQLQALGYPLLVGWSRKSMIGELLSREIPDRLYGSVGAATLAACRGVEILRVHDVAATKDAVTVAMAIA